MRVRVLLFLAESTVTLPVPLSEMQRRSSLSANARVENDISELANCGRRF